MKGEIRKTFSRHETGVTGESLIVNLSSPKRGAKREESRVIKKT